MLPLQVTTGPLFHTFFHGSESCDPPENHFFLNNFITLKWDFTVVKNISSLQIFLLPNGPTKLTPNPEYVSNRIKTWVCIWALKIIQCLPILLLVPVHMSPSPRHSNISHHIFTIAVSIFSFSHHNSRTLNTKACFGCIQN